MSIPARNGSAAGFVTPHSRWRTRVPVDQLTVGDIVARAEVSRQVFYQHFADRDDAVAYAFSVAFASATADIAADPGARILALFDFAAEHRAMYRNIVPSAVTLRVVAAFRTELAPACEQIATQAMPAVPAVAGLTPESVSQFLVGGFIEVLRSWMEARTPPTCGQGHCGTTTPSARYSASPWPPLRADPRFDYARKVSMAKRASPEIKGPGSEIWRWRCSH